MNSLGLTMDNKARLLALLAAILAAAAMRLLPHPPNFSPIAAIALFGGAYMPKRALAFVVPFGALLLSDAALGGFYAGIEVVYLSFGLTVLIGWAIAERRSAVTVAGAAITSSLLFFIVTNFGVWFSGGLYTRTWDGLAACYAAAIPFFQNTLAGDLFFTALLFGGFGLAERIVPSLRRPDVAVAG